jgi:pyruvate dehydrogenase E1 component beta subunit
MLESEMAYNWTGEVPEEEYLIPFGKADIKREGKDVTLVVHGKPVRMALEAADRLADMGIDAEVLDLRSLRPLDEDAIYRSVRKTNRAVVIDESWPMASVGSHVGWMISRNCFDDLDAPVEFVHSEDVPMPYNHTLELAIQPSVEKVVAAVKRVTYKE